MSSDPAPPQYCGLEMHARGNFPRDFESCVTCGACAAGETSEADENFDIRDLIMTRGQRGMRDFRVLREPRDKRGPVATHEPRVNDSRAGPESPESVISSTKLPRLHRSRIGSHVFGEFNDSLRAGDPSQPRVETILKIRSDFPTTNPHVVHKTQTGPRPERVVTLLPFRLRACQAVRLRLAASRLESPPPRRRWPRLAAQWAAARPR